MGALLILGHFCHLVSLGLTAIGLVVLAVTSPPADGTSRRRLARLYP